MEYLQEYIVDVQKTLDQLPIGDIREVIEILHRGRLAKRQIFVVGNGGSASTASHIVCDLAKNTRNPLAPHIRIMELTDNSAIFSAYANDDGYDNVFALQLANFIEAQDIVVAISTSGNSENVIRAVKLARANGAITIGMTGFNGGQLISLVDKNIHVPSDNIEQVEDIHLMLGHIITTNLRNLIAEAPAVFSDIENQVVQN